MSLIGFTLGTLTMHGQITSKPDTTNMVKTSLFSDRGEEQAFIALNESYFTYYGCWFRKKGKISEDWIGQVIVSNENIEKHFKLFEGEYLPCFNIIRYTYFDKIISYDRTEYDDVYAFFAPKQTNKALRGARRCLLYYDEYAEQISWKHWDKDPKMVKGYIHVKTVNPLKITSNFSFFLSGTELEFLNERQLKVSSLL